MSNKTTLNPASPAIAPVEITDAVFKANPFPFYARLREEAPVYPMTVKLPTGRQRAWFITRYDDVLSVLKEERFVKNPRAAMTPEQWKKSPKMPPLFKGLQRNLLALDPPDHTRLRALVHKAFTPRMVEQMRDQVQTLTDDLLTAAERKGSMDLIEDFALPIPLFMIGHILGIPAEDNPRVHNWMRVFLSAGSNRNPFELVPNLMRFMGYLRKLIRARASNPQDDLITAMVQAREGDDRLTEDEILSLIGILFSAGHETTVNLIGSGTLALLENPEQLSKLRQNPSLGKTAVEEIVRFVCPAEMATERYTREDVEVAGMVIPRGELVLAVVGSANRDATHFANPDQLDITRQDNKHLGFGQGIHYCVGAPLARLEGQIALTSLVQRLPRLRLAVPAEQLRWRGGFIIRGLESLPVTF